MANDIARSVELIMMCSTLLHCSATYKDAKGEKEEESAAEEVAL